MADEASISNTLQAWAREQQLNQASLSDDGTSLSLGGTTLPATTILTVSHEGKSCSYSVASIYLQLIDPNQSFLVYRSACKKYNVSDLVKALEKPVILGHFLGVSTGLASESAPPVSATDGGAAPSAPEVAPAAEEPSQSAAPNKSSADRDKKKDRDRKRERERSRRKEEERHKSKQKKPPKTIGNEVLFDRLNVVVDKRQTADQKHQEELKLALSAVGFEITPEMLEKHREQAKRILANEIPVGNSASILRAANPRKDLSRVLELYNEATVTKVILGKHGRGAPRPPPPPTGTPVRKHLLGKKPIIVVPNGMTAIITLLNAHEFLSNAKFVPRDIVVKQGLHRNPPTTFTRSVRGATGALGQLEYEIMDNPRKLGNSEQEWDRIVAVIALGQSWQFKDWLRGYNSPASLFDKVYGFFLNLEGDKIPPEVPGWAVHHSRLNRDKRGLDQVSYATFWNGLDEWMRVRKPELLPQMEA